MRIDFYNDKTGIRTGSFGKLFRETEVNNMSYFTKDQHTYKVNHCQGGSEPYGILNKTKHDCKNSSKTRDSNLTIKYKLQRVYYKLNDDFEI